MTFKNKLNQIKALLSMEVKLAQMKLEDGTIIEAEQFEPEYSVGVVTEEGIVPLPVGEYAMEDGTMLVVAQEGIIAEVKAVEAEPEAEAPEMAQEPQEPQAATPKRVVESVSKETFFEAVEKINALEKELAEFKAEKEKVEMSANEPTPIVHNPEKKQPEPVAFVRRETFKSNIYKNLFN